MAQSQIVLTTAATEEGFDSDSWSVEDTNRYMENLKQYGLTGEDMLISNTKSAGNHLIPIDVIMWMFGTKEEQDFICAHVCGYDRND